MDREMSLTELRDEVNKINSEIINLLERRFEISEEVGKYKFKNNLPVEDKKKELEIIDSRVKSTYLDKEFIIKLFTLIFEKSKKLQNDLKLK